MIHDITHCTGEDVERNICPKRDTCRRYLAHLELRKGYIGGQYTYYRVSDISDCEGMYDEVSNKSEQKGGAL